MNRLRVLMFHPALPPYRLDLFNALAARCAARIVFLNANLLSQTFDQGDLRSRLTADHKVLSSGITFRRRGVRFGIGRELRNYAPDVVVSTEFSPTTLAIMAHRRLARCVFAHVVWTDDSVMSVEHENRLRSVARRIVVPSVQGLIVTSEEVAALYRERYGAASPIGVSPIVQDEAEFQTRLDQALWVARAQCATHQLYGSRTILFVGRLVNAKRVDRLIRAFARVREEIPTSVLVLVGDGPERRRLEALARELDVAPVTFFVGRVEGQPLYAWYRAASVFALTSEFEPFGAVVNEALLAGVPVVCSDKAGARSLVRENLNGSVVDSSNPNALAVALTRWLKKARPLSEAAVSDTRASLMNSTFAEAAASYVALLERASCELRAGSR